MNKLPGEVYKKSAGWAPPHFRITKKKLFYRWASYGSQSYFYIWFWQKSYQENLYNTIAWILQHPKKQYIDWHTKNIWAKTIFFSMKELVQVERLAYSFKIWRNTMGFKNVGILLFIPGQIFDYHISQMERAVPKELHLKVFLIFNIFVAKRKNFFQISGTYPFHH